MRVKHKYSEKNRLDPYVPLERWQKDYSENKKYLNYEFYDVPEIVDLYKIDHTTGKTIFLKSEFLVYAKRTVDNKPKDYVIKPLDRNRLDKYLMPKENDYSGLSFFERFKKIWNNIPKLKMIYESIINSTISKVTSNIITGVIIGVLILIVWALFGIKIVDSLRPLM